MHNHVKTGVQFKGPADIGLDEGEAGPAEQVGYIALQAAGKVVHADHGGLHFNQHIAHPGTQETGAAGDQHGLAAQVKAGQAADN